MLGSFNTCFANQGLGLDFSEVSSWAKRRGHAFKRSRDVEGFAIGGSLAAIPQQPQPAQAYLPSSIFAIALRCTSSGPSAKRRVRAPA